jgi:DNA gyrase subunit A
MLQHTWAMINHDLGYKSDFGVPRVVTRQFARIASLLEIADDEFVRAKNTLVEYENEIHNQIINDEAYRNQTLKEKITNLKNKYGDARRTVITQINDSSKEEKEIEFVEPEKCVVIMTEGGLVKRIPSTSFRTQKRNGKGVKTQDDITNAVIRTNTIDSLMVFTDKGKMYRLLVNDIPVGTNVSKGQPINSLITMESDEQPATIYSIYRDTDAKYVLFTTKNGMVKKTALEEYIKTKKKSGIAAITLKEGDSLANVVLIKDEPIVLITKSGMGIKFKSEDISASSRTTQGVRGITLKTEDEVIAALPIRDAKDQLAIFSKSGLGKKINLSELPIQSKGGKGLQCYKPTTSSGLAAAAALINDEDNILILGDKNSICISATEIPLMSRPSLGNQVIKNSNILSVSKV